MYSRILSKKVLGEVISASPDAGFQPLSLAKRVLNVLEKETQKPTICRMDNTGGETTYSMPVNTIAQQIEGGPSAHMVGRALGDMGLDKWRSRIGYIVFWSEKQIEILRIALETSHE